MNYRDRFFVFGLKRSGVACCKKLIDLGATVYAYDENINDIDNLIKIGCKRVENVDEVINICDTLVISPAIPIDHEISIKFKNLGKRVIGELELGYKLSLSPLIAVSGTNGKTTVVSLIDYGLKCGKFDSYLVGNIGNPIIEKSDDLGALSVGVVEVSSFQLESVFSFTPHIGVMLNISPDHLDRHYTMDNYIYLKKKLFCNMRESEYAILNYDDLVVRDFAKSLKCKVKYFSTKEEVSGGYISDDYFMYDGERIMERQKLSLKGEHNESNALAAIVSLKLYGVSNKDIEYALSTFKGVDHRIQLIYENNDIKCFDDSKATNVSSAIVGGKAMLDTTLMILGGKDKGENFDELFIGLKDSNVKRFVITGECRDKIYQSAIKNGITNISIEPNFVNAVELAINICKGENLKCLLLSPATASFDMFESYEERGNKFCEVVKRAFKQ